MVGCFFQSFSAPIAYGCFGATSPLPGSVILALAMAPSVLGGPLVQRFRPKRTLVVSMGVTTASVAALALFVATGAEGAFMVACGLFSVAMGAALATALRMLLLEVNVLQVSAILSSVNLVAYAGSAVTGLLCGALLGATSYVVVFAVMTLVLAVSCAFVVATVRTARARKKSKRLTLRRFHKKRNAELAALDEVPPEVIAEDAAPALA